MLFAKERNYMPEGTCDGDGQMLNLLSRQTLPERDPDEDPERPRPEYL